MWGRTKADLSWLGAEALPGGLAEINRVHQAWLDTAARHHRYVKELRQRGFGSGPTMDETMPLVGQVEF